jgi:hypothetical protein
MKNIEILQGVPRYIYIENTPESFDDAMSLVLNEGFLEEEIHSIDQSNGSGKLWYYLNTYRLTLPNGKKVDLSKAYSKGFRNYENVLRGVDNFNILKDMGFLTDIEDVRDGFFTQKRARAYLKIGSLLYIACDALLSEKVADSVIKSLDKHTMKSPDWDYLNRGEH